MDMEKEIFEIISNGGDAKAIAYEALELAHENHFQQAEEKLKEADQTLNTAHNTQTRLIQAELNGEGAPMTLLMVHAQDHLMAAISEMSLIENMIKLLKRISELEKK
ncbi:PTS lactose/cellobiose transporter subunit IIA [Oceanobacillus sp. FSL W7-1293]|uniref:PTS lactose/cellobiose transporter subunit IIA n=1 Tax=Oceanobacillus TaxID=182709 RepID=UPI0030D51A9F